MLRPNQTSCPTRETRMWFLSKLNCLYKQEEEKTESVDQSQHRKETLRYSEFQSSATSPHLVCAVDVGHIKPRGGPGGLTGLDVVRCRPIRRRSGISVDADQRGFSRSWSPVSRRPSMEASGGAERPDCPLTPQGSLLDADRGTISHSDLFFMVGDGRMKHIWTNYRGKTPGCIIMLYFYPTKSIIWDTHRAFVDVIFYWSLLCFFINTDHLQKGILLVLNSQKKKCLNSNMAEFEWGKM